MGIEQRVREQFEYFNQHDLKAIEASYAESATVIDPQYDQPIKGVQAIVKDAADFFRAFPDLKGTMGELLTNGNTYAYEARASGTHNGDIDLPEFKVPATNRRMEFALSVCGRLDEEGKIVEERRYYDVAGQLQQLGVTQ